MRPFSTSPSPIQQNYFLSQPHQPFFVFGVVWAIVGMIIFTLAHKGVLFLNIPENEFHLYSLAFIVFAQFFHGFLFTTFPRFCTSMTIPKEVYTRIVWLYQLGSALFFLGVFIHVWLLLLAVALLVFAHSMAIYTLYWVYQNGQARLKEDPYWILVAHAIAFITHIVWLFSMVLVAFDLIPSLIFIISPIIVNLFLIFLTFSVAQRMIPFFSHSMVEKSPHFLKIILAGLTLKTLSAILAFGFVEALISLALSFYIFREFLSWKFHPLSAPAILWILHLALFWLPLGLAISGIAQIIEAFYGIDFLFAGIHLLVLGFLTTILIGFGTRVTLGHSGQPPHADRFAITIFIWTQVVVMSRFAYSVQSALGADMEWLFDMASAGWILLFIMWSTRFAETLIFGRKVV